jgi:hypothetical protein
VLAHAQPQGRACRRCRRQMSDVRWQMSDGIRPTRPMPLHPSSHV